MTTSDEVPCCKVEIKIENQGDVNIYNCTEASTEPGDGHTCPPIATGACVPASLGAKPKQSLRRKLDTLLGANPVPSALGAGFFQLARRYLAGKAPANPIEERAFATFRQMPADHQRILACACDSFESVPADERDRLFASGVGGDVEQPLDGEQLTTAFAAEVAANVGIAVFADPDCPIVEHPGQVRTQPNPGGEFPPSQVRICRVNGLRTAQYTPPLAPGDYTPDEVQQRCHVVLEGNEPVLVCEVQTTDCVGHDVGGLCLRVQDVEAGQAVLLEGVNFSSIDTKVRLTEVSTSLFRDIDTRVCGDLDTPLTETINGVETPILDCRVHDRLTFPVPDDLAPGLYDIQVLVPNVAGLGWGDTLFSDGVRGISVLLPSSARFQIASETLHCREETSPASFGSDEVGLNILGVPLFPDLTGGEAQRPNGGSPIRFGDVDSGDNRAMDHVLFAHQQPILGLALSIMGYEIDGERAFEQQIEGFTESLLDVLSQEWEFLKEHLDAEDIKKIIEFGMDHPVLLAVAVAVAIAVTIIVALWAPADLIIADAVGPTTFDLIQLTSVNYPLPEPSEYETAGGIKVKVTPLDKTPNQYRERREYICDDEDSRYEIVLRYNRLA